MQRVGGIRLVMDSVWYTTEGVAGAGQYFQGYKDGNDITAYHCISLQWDVSSSYTTALFKHCLSGIC